MGLDGGGVFGMSLSSHGTISAARTPQSRPQNALGGSVSSTYKKKAPAIQGSARSSCRLMPPTMGLGDSSRKRNKGESPEVS